MRSPPSWTLYDSEDKVEAYEHFDPPLILEVDKVLGKIRNEKYRYFNSDVTLFPTLANKYEPEVIRELLHNAIAHQDYRLSSKINVLEYEDRLVFMNEGSFIPGTIEKAIEPGFKPRYYRNRLLSDVMSPVVPALTTAGFISVLLVLLQLCGIITSTSTTYVILNGFAQSAFYFLPVFVAYTAARKFETEPVLAMHLRMIDSSCGSMVGLC